MAELRGPRSRHVIDTDRGALSFTRSGAGDRSAVVIGPLGSSSAQVRWFLDRSAATHVLLAPDLAGTGLSDLTEPAVTIGELAGDVVAMLDALGLDRAPIVGIGFGGLVAIEVARLHPERCPALLLHDVPVLDADDRHAWMTAYAPATTPDVEGTHLLRQWRRRRDEEVFFPWFDRSAAGRIDTADLAHPEKLLEVHQSVVDRLAAGATEPDVHLAALSYDAAAALGEVGAPIVSTSSDHPRKGRVDEHASHARVIGLSGATEERRRQVATLATELIAEHGGARPSIPALDVPTGRTRLATRFASTRWGQLAVRCGAPEGSTERPLVMLHSSPLSGESLRPFAEELVKSRPVVVLDTLGNGDSDKPDGDLTAEFHAPHIEHFARVAAAAVADLGITEYDVYGSHTGALIALELGVLQPQEVRNVLLDGVPLFAPETVRNGLENYFVDQTPRWNAVHLLEVWGNTTDSLLWWPWNLRDPAHAVTLDTMDPDRLNRFCVGMLKSGTSYTASYTAAFLHPTRHRLPLLQNRVAFCRRPEDALNRYLDEASTLVPRSEVVALTDDTTADAAILKAWLRRK